jgi:hypothetical protein
MDVSTLRSRELREYAEYLDQRDNDYNFDFDYPRKLNFTHWRERENPQDPDVDE